MVFGFKVFIRGKGQAFQPVTHLVFPRKKALALGQREVMQKNGMEFKLKPTFGEPGFSQRVMKFKPKNFTKRGRVFSLRLTPQKGF